MQITVRRAALDDMDQLNHLTDSMHVALADLYGLELSEEDLEKEHFCTGELETVLVAEDAEAGLVGYLSYSKGENEWVGPHYSVDHLSIHEDFIGQGVGRELFNHLLERAKEEGLNVTTGTLERNKRALEFYQRLGFKPYNVHLVLDLQKRLHRD